jgi:hypothetical protein
MVEKHKEKRSQNYDQRERKSDREREKHERERERSTRERLIEGFFDSILKLLKIKRQKL